MNEVEVEIWDLLKRHVRSIFTRDVETYRNTTSEDLSLYEWYITPHRQDGLDFHFFMVEQLTRAYRGIQARLQTLLEGSR